MEVCVIDTANIIKKLNDLYIIQRNHYLIQYPHIGYRQYRKGDKLHGNFKVKGLLNWQFEKHLIGEYTIGTFAQEFTKFISFDIDYINSFRAKMATYKIIRTLDDLRFHDYYISYSGNKGYHIDIFIEDLISIHQAKTFFQFILDQSEIERDRYGQVEFRPTKALGVKLPLGVHQSTNQFCGYCTVENGLQPMNMEESVLHLYAIQKVKRQELLDIMATEEELLLDGSVIEKERLEKTEEAISTHKILKNEESGEDYSIDIAQDLLINGLRMQGTRHKSLFKICLYFKYMGLSETENKEKLIEWMSWQDPNTYTTTLAECHSEIDRMLKTTYEKDYSISYETVDLSVTLDEIKWIIEKCPEKNQKLLAYAFLIHSKRWADKDGIFWFTYGDIQKSTNIDDNTVGRQINKMEKLGVIEIVRRNQTQKGRGLKRKLPNLYKMGYNKLYIGEARPSLLADRELKVLNTSKFEDIARTFYTDKQLKKMLPRRQYESLFINDKG